MLDTKLIYFLTVFGYYTILGPENKEWPISQVYYLSKTKNSGLQSDGVSMYGPGLYMILHI